MSAEPVTRRRYRKRLEPSERRDSILDSTLRLVTRVDSLGISMTQVAEEEGVSKPVVYDHFANVDELLAALFARERRLAIVSLLALMSERDLELPADQRLEFALSRATLYLTFIADRPDRWRLTLVPPLGLSPEARKEIDVGKQAVYDHLRDLIAWSVPDSESLDLDLITHAIQAVLERMAQLVIDDGEGFSIERGVEFFTTQVGWWLIGRTALST